MARQADDDLREARNRLSERLIRQVRPPAPRKKQRSPAAPRRTNPERPERSRAVSNLKQVASAFPNLNIPMMPQTT